MSLINDALKRASQGPPPTSTPVAELHPVEYPKVSWAPIATIAAVIIGVVGLGVFLVFKGVYLAKNRVLPATNEAPMTVAARTAAPPPNPAPATVNPAAVPAAPTNAVAKPVAGGQVGKETESRRAAVSKTTLSTNRPAPAKSSGPHKPAAARASEAANQAAPAKTEKPDFPVLRLKGIFYRPSNPSAMINGKTVFRGDRIGDVKVLAVEPASVTVEWAGQIKVLTLP